MMMPMILPAAFRFFRVLLRMNNRNVFNHIIKYDLLRPVLELTMKESRRDNLLSSTCQEFFEHMRKVRFALLFFFLFFFWISLSPTSPVVWYRLPFTIVTREVRPLHIHLFVRSFFPELGFSVPRCGGFFDTLIPHLH